MHRNYPMCVFALLALVSASAPVASAVTPTQLAKLTTLNGASGDNMGQAVALAGNLLFVGVPFRTVGSNAWQGTVDVYVKPSTGWHDGTQTLTLKASDGQAYQAFGFALAASGNTLAVSAPSWSGGCTSRGGAVYVFQKSSAGIKQVAELTPSDSIPCDGFGFSVAISGDTIVVGSPASTQHGQAYVFVKPASGWVNATETAKLTPSDGSQGWFGAAVAVDGNTAVVGYYMQAFSGEAYVYVKPTNGWASMTETAKLSPSHGGVGDSFGLAVAISGTTILVGSPNHPVGWYYGAGYIYVMPPTGWVNATETAKLTASGSQTYDQLGTSVALQGKTALLGAPNVFYPIAKDAGQAYIFVEPSTGWKSTSRFQAKLTSSDGVSTDAFGTGVALSGKTAAIGAPLVHWDPSFTSPGPGATYVFGW